MQLPSGPGAKLLSLTLAAISIAPALQAKGQTGYAQNPAPASQGASDFRAQSVPGGGVSFISGREIIMDRVSPSTGEHGTTLKLMGGGTCSVTGGHAAIGTLGSAKAVNPAQFQTLSNDFAAYEADAAAGKPNLAGDQAKIVADAAALRVATQDCTVAPADTVVQRPTRPAVGLAALAQPPILKGRGDGVSYVSVALPDGDTAAFQQSGLLKQTSLTTAAGGIYKYSVDSKTAIGDVVETVRTGGETERVPRPELNASFAKLSVELEAQMASDSTAPLPGVIAAAASIHKPPAQPATAPIVRPARPPGI